MIRPGVRVFVCTEPVDMRLGFDRLAQLARERVGEDPEGGSLFVYGNKAANRLKCLWFDTNGYCVLYKRLHRSVFEMPIGVGHSSSVVRIDGAALARLIAGVAKKNRQKSRLRAG